MTSAAHAELMHLFDPEPYTLSPEKRWPCPRCGGMPIPAPAFEPFPYPADPCLGWLADVAGACCGHGLSGDPDPWDRTGDHRRPYVAISPGSRSHTGVDKLTDNVILHGDEALAFFRSLGVGPP